MGRLDWFYFFQLREVMQVKNCQQPTVSPRLCRLDAREELDVLKHYDMLIVGAELARMAGRQAEKFGAELMLLRGVVGSRAGDDGKTVVQVAGGHEVTADAMLAAPGMRWRRLEIDGVDELLGRGVYYGAGRSE